jgi:hypothetical protein
MGTTQACPRDAAYGAPPLTPAICQSNDHSAGTVPRVTMANRAVDSRAGHGHPGP